MKKILLSLGLLFSFNHVLCGVAPRTGELVDLAFCAGVGNFAAGFLVNVFSDNTVKEKCIGNTVGAAIALFGNIFAFQLGQKMLADFKTHGSVPPKDSVFFDDSGATYIGWSAVCYILGGFAGYLARGGVNKGWQGICNAYNWCTGAKVE